MDAGSVAGLGRWDSPAGGSGAADEGKGKTLFLTHISGFLTGTLQADTGVAQPVAVIKCRAGTRTPGEGGGERPRNRRRGQFGNQSQNLPGWVGLALPVAPDLSPGF